MQTFTEQRMLGLMGGSLGCALAWWLLRVFVSLALAKERCRLREAALDPRVLTFTLALSAGTAARLGLAPMLDGSVPERLLNGGRFTGVRRGMAAAPALVMGKGSRSPSFCSLEQELFLDEPVEAAETHRSESIRKA